MAELGNEGTCSYKESLTGLTMAELGNIGSYKESLTGYKWVNREI